MTSYAPGPGLSLPSRSEQFRLDSQEQANKHAQIAIPLHGVALYLVRRLQYIDWRMEELCLLCLWQKGCSVREAGCTAIKLKKHVHDNGGAPLRVQWMV